MQLCWPRFSLKAFHRVVLQNGALPLALLEQQVETWIEATRRAGPAGELSTDP
jgi:uncharacterized protein (DUF885 family)